MRKVILCLSVLIGASFAVPAQAVPVSLEGLGLIKQWTDLENQAGDMPDMIWGTSDTDSADRIGIYVEFENGLTGSATYDGVAGLWNSSNFAGVAADTATGFFTSAGGLHFLFNSNATLNFPEALPMAWTGFVMDFSNNFDLDYHESVGSNFRASVQGWVAATIATYSSSYRVNDVPEPAPLALLGLGLLAFGVTRMRRR